MRPLRFVQDETTGNVRLAEDVFLPMPLGLPSFHVPAGFLSDGQSAPRGLWAITGPPIRTPFMRAWLGHDLACVRSRTWSERAVADALLAWWLVQLGASRWKALMTFWACFTYGRLAFLRRDGWR